MNWRSFLLPAAGAALAFLAWRGAGWQGLALAASAAVLWFLLHYTRLITVMKRAADRPIGYVGSAVMLNARLKAGMPLLNVIGLTRSLGEQTSPEGAEPQVLCWRDAGESQVTAEFQDGRLLRWQLQRPPEAPAAAPEPLDAPPPPGQPPLPAQGAS